MTGVAVLLEGNSLPIICLEGFMCNITYFVSGKDLSLSYMLGTHKHSITCFIHLSVMNVYGVTNRQVDQRTCSFYHVSMQKCAHEWIICCC